jgi:hypothetical protein
MLARSKAEKRIKAVVRPTMAPRASNGKHADRLRNDG